MRLLVQEGYRVALLAPDAKDGYFDKFVEIGVEPHAIAMRMNTNPLSDAKLMAGFYRRLRALRPAMYLGFTVKPNVYGSIAAHRLSIPVINNVAGLGSVFTSESVLRRIVGGLYKVGLSRSRMVFFQNTDDRRLFLDEGILRHDRHDLLPGSGVDLDRYTVTPEPQDVPVRFLLIARMIGEKGIGEFVKAARVLRKNGMTTEFRLMGATAVDNPTAIPREQIQSWEDEGIVTYRAFSEDVASEIRAAHCIVLPSFYREGTPRTMLEASASGRPIITTDMPGCRDVVDDGQNGFLCLPRSSADLADKMMRIASMSSEERTAMGLAGRRKMEREYDERIVLDKYLDLIRQAAPL